MKTLQQEYQLIQEGKGDKDHFLRQAKYLFPDYITSGNDYNTAVHILKSKSLLSEGIGGVISINNQQPDWFKIFNEKLNEAVGVKDTKEYGNQNSFDKIDKDVQDVLDHNFDNKDPKNIDNVYGHSFLMGYYTEMKDPKNTDKTVDELKQIVLKNMVKDVNYYHTNASFGVKGIGYTKDVISGGEPKEPKGKFKSSGYGDIPKAKTVKEGLNESEWNKEYKDQKIKERESLLQAMKLAKNLSKKEGSVKHVNILPNGLRGVSNAYHRYVTVFSYENGIETDKFTDLSPKDYARVKAGLEPEEKGWDAVRAALKENKKPNIQKQIKDLDQQSEILALENKISAIGEAIEDRKSKISLSETEELKELVNPARVKELQKEIKQLEKYKATCEKLLSKKGGKTIIDESPIDESPIDEENYNEFQ